MLRNSEDNTSYRKTSPSRKYEKKEKEKNHRQQLMIRVPGDRPRRVSPDIKYFCRCDFLLV